MDHHACSHHCQHYRFLVWCWCITHIDDLLAHRGDIEPETLTITTLDTEIGLHAPPEQSAGLGTRINRDHAATVDLTRPVYVAELLHPTRADESVGFRLIDGWHRVYRARTEGHDTLPAIRIPRDIERAASRPLLR